MKGSSLFEYLKSLIERAASSNGANNFNNLSSHLERAAYVCRRYGRSKAFETLTIFNDYNSGGEKAALRAAREVFRNLEGRAQNDSELAKLLGMARRVAYIIHKERGKRQREGENRNSQNNRYSGKSLGDKLRERLRR